MGWRHSELGAFGHTVVPLGSADALAVFGSALEHSSRTRYGLNETIFTSIDRLDVNDPGPGARRWLAERVGDGELLLAFAENEVFRMPATLFLDNWRDMFCPSRDDVFVLPAGGGWVLFYCHEDEFEFARGGPS